MIEPRFISQQLTEYNGSDLVGITGTLFCYPLSTFCVH